MLVCRSSPASRPLLTSPRTPTAICPLQHTRVFPSSAQATALERHSPGNHLNFWGRRLRCAEPGWGRGPLRCGRGSVLTKTATDLVSSCEIVHWRCLTIVCVQIAIYFGVYVKATPVRLSVPESQFSPRSGSLPFTSGAQSSALAATPYVMVSFMD